MVVMTNKSYIIEGRHFRTENDYKLGLRDKQTITQIKSSEKFNEIEFLENLLQKIEKNEIKLYTILKEDFLEEILEQIDRCNQQLNDKNKGKKEKKNKTNQSNQRSSNKTNTRNRLDENKIDEFARKKLMKIERNRRFIAFSCGIIAVFCIGYFAFYSFQSYRTRRNYEYLSELKEDGNGNASDSSALSNYGLSGETLAPEILEEYKKIYNMNKKLIGWLKIDDTNIDYPVMQTDNNEYYLDHNLNQEKDNNGSIFMDKECDVILGNTNFILYGHHMKDGSMFGGLSKYSSKEYYSEHKYINFDTIYEKGTYEVMYVFRSEIYNKEDIVFKYYQFIDAVSEKEFNSYMKEMEAISLYETGVTAQYGDKLLTLSTCDYSVADGRFVVVAKRIE